MTRGETDGMSARCRAGPVGRVRHRGRWHAPGREMHSWRWRT